MDSLDIAIVAIYLSCALWVGRRLSKPQRTVHHYFLTEHSTPWWAVMASIVATETSTVTLISVPGYAFGGDLTFIQIAIGYMIGRAIVAFFMLSPYFKKNLLTAYQLLADRFGKRLGRLAAIIFLLSRNISDGLRLFATALVLAVVFASTQTGPLEPTDSIVVVSIFVIAVVTLTYTWLGGMTAVIWMDVTQLILYLSGTAVAAILLLTMLSGEWSSIWIAASNSNKLTLFDFTFTLTRDYTFWSAIIGGVFFTAATHGTDQMFVQRYLCCRSVSEARRALIISGVVIFFQFAIFLFIGILLWAYYMGPAGTTLSSITIDGAIQTDRVFPLFIVTNFPTGLKGLIVAAIMAAAMSTLSSSLNSSASSLIGDFYINQNGVSHSNRHLMRLARWATVACALFQIFVALAAIQSSQRVIDNVLSVQFFTGGLVLGIFLLSMIDSARLPAVGFSALISGFLAMLLLSNLTDVSWQWYTLIGTVTTVGVGSLVSNIFQSVPGKAD